MIMTTQRKAMTVSGEIKPRITLLAKDYERLSLLARAAATRMPDLASTLTEELERAHVLADDRSKQSVCMGSEVQFRDDTTGSVKTVTLVSPAVRTFRRQEYPLKNCLSRADRAQRRRFHYLGNTDRRTSAIDRP